MRTLKSATMKSLSEVTYSDMNIIAEYMDDCLKEYVEFHFSPCTPEKFLREYIKREPSFNDVLKREFSVRCRNESTRN